LNRRFSIHVADIINETTTAVVLDVRVVADVPVDAVVCADPDSNDDHGVYADDDDVAAVGVSFFFLLILSARLKVVSALPRIHLGRCGATP